MAWDQGYYEDPNQYGQDQYMYDAGYGYDAYGYDQSYGYDPYDPYGYYGYQEPQEDTESEKQRKEQAEKERIEALEANRLYLRKIQKHCAREDFADLDKLQLFLFEVLVENMEVNTEGGLGLVPDNKNQLSFISARVQFLNSPWIEICERDKVLEGTSPETSVETEYLQTIGDAGLEQYSAPEMYRDPYETERTQTTSGEEGEGEESVEGVEEVEELQITTRWENASGKSCLFSETPMMIIRDMERYPVVLQAVRCVVDNEGTETCEPIGYAQIRLPDDFSLSVIQSSKDGVILPVSSVHRETLDIRNVFGVKKGRVNLFLRLSSFGPAIVTSFQSSGEDRKYIFKPSPLDANFKQEKASEETPRSELLKPIIAEEERTYGITVNKEYDFFQKPVLWKRNSDGFNCGCKGGPNDDDGISRFSSLGSLRLPISSELSLCKDTLPPSEFRKLKFDKSTCDWHNIVSSGIKNSPGGNCGCLDSAQKPGEGESQLKSGKTSLGSLSVPSGVGEKVQKKSRKKPEESIGNVSRIQKMMKPINVKPPTEGIGLVKECTDCGCDCPTIREALDSNKLFLI